MSERPKRTAKFKSRRGRHRRPPRMSVIIETLGIPLNRQQQDFLTNDLSTTREKYEQDEEMRRQPTSLELVGRLKRITNTVEELISLLGEPAPPPSILDLAPPLGRLEISSKHGHYALGPLKNCLFEAAKEEMEQTTVIHNIMNYVLEGQYPCLQEILDQLARLQLWAQKAASSPSLAAKKQISKIDAELMAAIRLITLWSSLVGKSAKTGKLNKLDSKLAKFAQTAAEELEIPLSRRVIREAAGYCSSDH